jgi:hypothetical protein
MSQEAGTSERNVGGMGHIRNASRSGKCQRDVMVTRISHPLAT